MIRDCQCPRANHQHGTWHAYATDNCHCTPCRAAWTAYTRHLRKRRHFARGPVLMDGTGVARRLQALAVNGWGTPDLARELGLTRYVIGQWQAGGTRVTPTTHARIAALYDRLWDKPTPGRYAVKIRRVANAKGWHPPLAWDNIDDPDEQPGHIEDAGGIDEIAVVRIMAGTLVAASSPERTEAIRRLARQGLDDPQIGDRLGLSSSAAGADRRRHGIPAGVPMNRPAKGAAA